MFGVYDKMIVNYVRRLRKHGAKVNSKIVMAQHVESSFVKLLNYFTTAVVLKKLQGTGNGHYFEELSM